jgi:hypothetical protein
MLSHMKKAFTAYETVISISGKVIALILVIIAVSSVAGIVIFQSLINNSNSSNPQVETLELMNEHIWFNQTGWAEAAIVVVNTGEGDVLLQRIMVRSIESKWSDIYYWTTNTGPVSSELKQTPVELSGPSFSILIDGTPRNFEQATAKLNLGSGWTIVLYNRNPGNITSSNVGSKATIAVFTENKLYFKEADIEAQFTFMKTEELKVTSMTFGGTSGSANNTIVLSIRNSGTSKVTVTEVRVNDVAKSFSGTAAYDAGATGTITVYMGSGYWTTGNKYKVSLLSATGTTVAAYETTA